MPHARETIRKAVKTRLTGLTTTGSNVFDWALHAISETIMPAISVYVETEALSDSIDDEFGDTEVRDLSVMVEARAKSATGSRVNVLDTGDDACLEIEVAMASDYTLGGLAIDCKLTRTDIELDGSGDTPVVNIKQEWLVRYSVDRTNPAG